MSGTRCWREPEENETEQSGEEPAAEVAAKLGLCRTRVHGGKAKVRSATTGIYPLRRVKKRRGTLRIGGMIDAGSWYDARVHEAN
jgi:hypothetical protein